MTTPPGERPSGTLVKGKWRLTSVLRSGTAAAVYLAKARAGSDVALKIVHAHLASDDLVRRRLLEEAEVLASLDHPAIVRVLDEDVADDGAPLLLLEPLDGETLDRRAARLGGALALEDVFDVADLLLEFLRVAHGRGVLHFDITPENLFLTDTGLLKILDFGALQAPAPSGARTGAATGRAFTAPELLLDEASDARSDIWAVGALMFSLVTGSPPRAHDAPAHSVASVPARVLRDSPLDLPRAFVNIVDRALEFDRADRWPDVEAMQQALRWARRSLESGWGGGETNDPLVPRPSRSSLAEQARLARLSATLRALGGRAAQRPDARRGHHARAPARRGRQELDKSGADVATPRPEIEEHTPSSAHRASSHRTASRARPKISVRSRAALPSRRFRASDRPDSEKTKTSAAAPRPAGRAGDAAAARLVDQ
ncbi:MAG: serine/threonine-protein kinase [Polyangiaceae bacterium]